MDRRTATSALLAVDRRLISLQGRPVESGFLRRRRRTLGITIDSSGVAVSAPLRAPLRDIESFLRDKESWILAKIEEWSRVPRPAELSVESGEMLPLFGEPVTLDVRDGGRAVRHEDDRLVVCASGARRVAETLIGWLKTKALETLAPRVEHFAARLGVPVPSVALCSARGQWGVCIEGGLIRLNWRLVHLAPQLADYVAAHEAAHLVEMNHSKRFWGLVAGLYPSWREAREELELAGAAIPIIRGVT